MTYFIHLHRHLPVQDCAALRRLVRCLISTKYSLRKECIKAGCHKTAEETVGREKRTHKPWICSDTKDLIELRRSAKKNRDQKNSEESNAKYREPEQKVKNSTENDLKIWHESGHRQRSWRRRQRTQIREKYLKKLKS